jgi:acyl-CoA thioesterase-1
MSIQVFSTRFRPVRAFCRRAALLFFVPAVALAAGCGTAENAVDSATSAPAAAEPSPKPASPPSGSARVVFLGDSLTAGLGLPIDDAYPTLLQRRIAEARLPFEVVNMGVSGDTSAGGLRRLEWALEGDVRVLVLALGANDGLRGLKPADMKTNLGRTIELAQARGIDVLLCGMEAPPNFGPAYTSAFRAAYRDLAREMSVTFLPFLLDGVAGVPSLNQTDGIHPNREGARRVAELVWSALEPMLVRRTTT